MKRSLCILFVSFLLGCLYVADTPFTVHLTAQEAVQKERAPIQLETVTVFLRGAGLSKQEGIYEWVDRAVRSASAEGFVPPKDISVVFQENADPDFRDGASISIVFNPKIISLSPHEGRAPTQLEKVTIALDGEEVFKQEGIYEWSCKAAQLVIEWFPIFDKIFETEEFIPGNEITLRFRRMDGVANASGTTIRISDNWVLRQSRQDFGMVAHEMIHIVQRYGGRGGTSIPGWAMEGVTDFARHAYYEPDVVMRRNGPNDTYRSSYQVTGGFFMWIEHVYDKEFVKKLNQHARNRTWPDDVFEKYTGKDAETLWKEHNEFLQTIPDNRILPSRDFGREKLGNTYSITQR